MVNKTKKITLYSKTTIKGHLRNAETSLNRTPLLCPIEIPHIEMCSVESSEIRTPPYARQLTVVPVVSLLGRFHCTGQLTLVPVVSLLRRFHCIPCNQ